MKATPRTHGHQRLAVRRFMTSGPPTAMVEAIPGVNPTVVRVEEAMVEDVFTVEPGAPIGEVADTMIARKLGSAVVIDGERVIGVFTTIDALVALRDLLKGRRRRSPDVR